MIITETAWPYCSKRDKSTSHMSELVKNRKIDKLIFILVSIGNDVVSWDV